MAESEGKMKSNETKLIKRNSKDKPYKVFGGYEAWGKQGQYCTYEHLTEYNDKEIIFTACVKIDYTTKKGKDLLKKMIKEQSSPIKIILQQKEANFRRDFREGKGIEEYELPEEIKKLINKED